MSKDKVGIITLYYKNYNYGGALQSYALPTYINNNYDLKAEQISYDFSNIPSKTDKSINRLNGIKSDFSIYGMKGIGRVVLKIINKIAWCLFNKRELQAINERKQAFLEFEQYIPHSNRIYKDDDIINTLDIYDIFICGGDQIWNEWGFIQSEKSPQIFTLSFVNPSHKKFSYAPSIPSTKLNPDYLKKIIPGISQLDYISVREKSSVPYIEKYVNKSVSSVLDPVFLLSREEWKKIMIPSKDKNYLFCYLLGDDLQQRKIVKRYAAKRQLKIVAIPYLNGTFRLCDLNFADIRYDRVDPREFLGMIYGADCVITDSFHALSFSVIFHKEVYVFERDTIVGGEKMNRRMSDFCESIGISSCLIRPKDILTQKSHQKIDYSVVDALLDERIQSSISYIDSILGQYKVI